MTSALPNFTDQDATRTLVRALRLLVILTAIVAPFVWWKLGWQSAMLLMAGACISAAGLWKWLRLMTVVMARMDASENQQTPRPMGGVLIGFFLTLGLMLVVLYGSLKVLDGSVYALFAGLGMGIVALSVEALKLAKMWTI